MQLSHSKREALIVGLATGVPQAVLVRDLALSGADLADYARRHRSSIVQLQVALHGQQGTFAGDVHTSVKSVRAEIQDFQQIMTRIEIRDELAAIRRGCWCALF